MFILFIILFRILISINIITTEFSNLCLKHKSNDIVKEKNKNIFKKKLEKKIKLCKNLNFVDENLIKKITWRELWHIDEYDFYKDVEEMYKKYKCKYSINDLKIYHDLNELEDIEVIKSNLDINDIEELFTCNKERAINIKEHLQAFSNNHLQNLCNFKNDSFEIQNTEKKNYIEKSQITYKLFNILLNLLINDLVCVYKNAIKYNYIQINNFKENIEQFQMPEQYTTKIIKLINFSYKILNTNLQNHNKNDKNIEYSIDLLLNSKHKKICTVDGYIRQSYKKFFIIQNYFKKKKFSKKELLCYTIKYLNSIDDKNIQQMCVLGLQSFFSKNLNISAPKFFKVLIFLYKFKNEKDFYNIDWYKQLFKLLSVLNCYNLKAIYVIKLFDKFSKNNSFLNYHLYFAINSVNALYNLQLYEDLQIYKKDIELLNFLVDLLTKVKCKLFSINYTNI